ncbi:GNAT family N-acetyltransferase [Pseudoalteromonas sp. YIC-656]|uniref:GNAT family N-acetyltransferase n=1 Tax=Pseudoalteromonas pernae TaxID=3118054 RepID=UPI0032427A2D
MPNKDSVMTLRPFIHADIDSLVAMLNDENVQRFLSPKIPFPYTYEDATWWVEEGSCAGLTRAVQVDGKLVGCIGALAGVHEYQHSAEVGYWFGKEHWGQGFAQKALTLLIEEVVETSQWVRLFAMVFEGNHASVNVLQKCGFVKEGQLKNAICKNQQFFDAHLFALILNRQADE